MTDLLSDIAHQITGCNGSTCCHKTGGRGGQYMRPGCECREAAADILALVREHMTSDEAEARAWNKLVGSADAWPDRMVFICGPDDMRAAILAALGDEP